jgi:hypothetical protein
MENIGKNPGLKKKYNFEYFKPSNNDLTWKEALLIYGMIIGSNIVIAIIIILLIKKN